jgi:hypothetical protein
MRLALNSLRPSATSCSKQFLFNPRVWIQFQELEHDATESAEEFANHEGGSPSEGSAGVWPSLRRAIAKLPQTAQCWDGTTSPDTGEFVPLSQCWRATNPKMVGGEPAARAINQSHEWTEDAPSACCSLKRPPRRDASLAVDRQTSMKGVSQRSKTRQTFPGGKAFPGEAGNNFLIEAPTTPLATKDDPTCLRL